VRVYTVRPGDTPAKIASMDEHAGCPKCARDLVLANRHKENVTMPNGFLTFRSLVPGERLWIPDKWSSPEFDRLPPAYFKALPHHDGVTRSSLGLAAAGVLGDFQALDTASSKVSALASMPDAQFNTSVGDAGTAINQAIQEAYGSANAAAAASAKTAQDGTQWAWNRNNDLTTALASGDVATVKAARLDVQNALTTALGNARLALEAYYAPGSTQAPVSADAGSVTPSARLTSAAQTLVAAIGADRGYCASVARSGAAVNGAVHAFKLAWNAEQAPAVPVGTGTYEQATADAVARVLGTSPAACGAGGHTGRAAPYAPIQQASSAARGGGLTPSSILGIGVLAAAGVAGVVFLARHKPAPSPYYYSPARHRR
jgi:hypothetical protein